MSADPRRDAAFRHFFRWQQDAQAAVWAGTKIPRIPVPKQDAGFTMTDVLAYVQTSSGRRIVDEIGQPMMPLDEAWGEVTERIVNDAISEAQHQWEEAQAAQRAAQPAPTRKRDLRDLTEEQSAELSAAAREGLYPSWIDSDALPQEVRDAAWRILPDEARAAYLEDHPQAEPATGETEQGDAAVEVE